MASLKDLKPKINGPFVELTDETGTYDFSEFMNIAKFDVTTEEEDVDLFHAPTLTDVTISGGSLQLAGVHDKAGAIAAFLWRNLGKEIMFAVKEDSAAVTSEANPLFEGEAVVPGHSAMSAEKKQRPKFDLSLPVGNHTKAVAPPAP